MGKTMWWPPHLQADMFLVSQNSTMVRASDSTSGGQAFNSSNSLLYAVTAISHSKLCLFIWKPSLDLIFTFSIKCMDELILYLGNSCNCCVFLYGNLTLGMSKYTIIFTNYQLLMVLSRPIKYPELYCVKIKCSELYCVKIKCSELYCLKIKCLELYCVTCWDTVIDFISIQEKDSSMNMLVRKKLIS